MASITLAYIVVVLWSVLYNLGVNCTTLSRKEDIELEKQLKLLDKPSAKTIKTKYGDVYDCVDFYKQPAFDHPLLKNHNFYPEMRPSVIPQWRTKPSNISTQVMNSIKLKDGGCPKGTVPIKRVTKDYLIQMRQVSKHFASRVKSNGLHPGPGTYATVLQSKSNPGTKYKGVGGTFSVYNLSVRPSQYSSSELILNQGNDTIRVGLMVNPSLNKDNRTRMFQYVEAGNLHCFDTLCPGFISLRLDIPINMVIDPVSKIGGPVYEYKFFIFQSLWVVYENSKDTRNGNWWLEVEKIGYVIGFWPGRIFTELAKLASYIAVGGEAYTPPTEPLPPMGNGLYPVCTRKDIYHSGYCDNFVTVDSNYDVIDNPGDFEVFNSSVEYGAIDIGITSYWGRLVCFGGPHTPPFNCMNKNNY